jgi:hypothetical protein
MEFGHKKHTKSLTTRMLALMGNEVPGPRLPGHLPLCSSYVSVSEPKSARKRVKNYSQKVIDTLLPIPQVHQEGNALRSTIAAEGMTQESYLVNDDDDDYDDATDNLFASSLLEKDSSPFEMASARDILKPQINEVLQCLDILRSKSSIEKATKLLDGLANELRLELGKTSGTKRNIDNCGTVNMNVEENVTKKSRTHASKNC